MERGPDGAQVAGRGTPGLGRAGRPFSVSVPLPEPISLWSLPGGRGDETVDRLAAELRLLAREEMRTPD